MTETQRQAMIRFHLKAAKAYRQFGKIKDAETAERMAKELEQKAKA